ncbi:MAG: FAD binding domain-containing protein [Elainellaceae cyanobacterium]
MDLYTVDTYLKPRQLQELPPWEDGWAWLAGGTWLFTEPQPQVDTLVDMGHLGWAEMEVSAAGLTLGATCIMGRLLEMDYPSEWCAVQALQSAVHELASFKIQNMATVAGNLCLALPASTFAPVMVLLGAEYLIQPLEGEPYLLPAAEFQVGAKQTVLNPGDILRQIYISADMLTWKVNYRRICVATAGIAVAIAVAAYNPVTQEVRVGLGSSIPAPRLLTFEGIPSAADIEAALDQHIPLEQFIDDATASASYRRHVTAVLIRRAIAEILSDT